MLISRRLHSSILFRVITSGGTGGRSRDKKRATSCTPTRGYNVTFLSINQIKIGIEWFCNIGNYAKRRINTSSNFHNVWHFIDRESIALSMFARCWNVQCSSAPSRTKLLPCSPFHCTAEDDCNSSRPGSNKNNNYLAAMLN